MDYTTLIPPLHADKPKFRALVSAITGSFDAQRQEAAGLYQYFDLDTAIGAQLDAVGLWVGIGRNINTPITGVYFSLDIAGVGLDQGVWKGPFDPDNGISVLPDDTYRILIKAKIGANHWDGSMDQWKAIVQQVFPPDTLIFAQDNGDMTMTVGVAGNQPSALFIALLKGGYLPLKPEAIGIKYAIDTVNNTAIFGLDSSTPYVSGLDVGAWATITTS